MLEVYAVVVTLLLVALVAFIAGYKLATARAAAGLAKLLFPAFEQDPKDEPSKPDPTIRTKPAGYV